MTEKNTSSRKLLSPEREERILAALGDGVRTIAELAAELQVSEATVRRDLQSLEQRALAMRVHGGAVRMQHGWSRCFTRRPAAAPEKRSASPNAPSNSSKRTTPSISTAAAPCSPSPGGWGRGAI